MSLFRVFFTIIWVSLIAGCSSHSIKPNVTVSLEHGIDESAGSLPAYIIRTPSAIYYLEKTGGGLSSVVDQNGVDWLGFNDEKGSGWKGEFRGFPNAVHRQDGNYFHAMNAKTDPSQGQVDFIKANHVRITFTSENEKWKAQWDFYPERCDFTMTEISPGYKYWVQYEGVPGGAMDPSDFWFSSEDELKHPIEQQRLSDLPSPEWMAFGDEQSPRMLYVLNHDDDSQPDDYVSRPYMTVLGFGRRNKDKFLETPMRFSIGFVESTEYSVVKNSIEALLTNN